LGDYKVSSLRNLFFFAAVWLMAAGLALLTAWPRIPRDIAEWIFLLVFGPPLYVAGEAFFTWLLAPERKYSTAQRFLLALSIIVLYVAGLLAWVAWEKQ
jgi:hypothetical protein